MLLHHIGIHILQPSIAILTFVFVQGFKNPSNALSAKGVFSHDFRIIQNALKKIPALLEAGIHTHIEQSLIEHLLLLEVSIWFLHSAYAPFRFTR